jgi:predicted nicotinamide N-methyase
MDSRQVFAEDYFVGKRIIEVGAGCGLTSIYAALRGADVTLTDMVRTYFICNTYYVKPLSCL